MRTSTFRIQHPGTFETSFLCLAGLTFFRPVQFFFVPDQLFPRLPKCLLSYLDMRFIHKAAKPYFSVPCNPVAYPVIFTIGTWFSFNLNRPVLQQILNLFLFLFVFLEYGHPLLHFQHLELRI